MYQGNYPNSFNITHRPGDKDYRDLIIRPSQDKMEKGRRTYILLVDSRDRNTTKFSNPAKFSVVCLRIRVFFEEYKGFAE